ncbi:MAG TPA: DICT sensory domain-containing protein [Solirubrobacteraceae bacterium]|nr:DICT sensory domain-containing protein [Solirubrobacteraceae bacterium]
MPTPTSAQLSRLSTTQLAELTGVPAATLRMWEARHGFPAPARLAGGHRRYGDRDVELVRAVVRARQDGLSLAAAIDRARAGDPPAPASIFAGLARRRPDLQPMTFTKPALLALSRAIEDEHLAAARAGVLIGSFQTARFYRQSERRWRELSRNASVAVVLADFKRLRRPSHGPVQVPVRRDHPLAREWAIVMHAPDASACIAAWEIPAPVQPADADRRFEVLWSPEPELVVDALAVATELIAPLAPDVAGALDASRSKAVLPSSAELRAAVRQAHRMLAYVGAD